MDLKKTSRGGTILGIRRKNRSPFEEGKEGKEIPRVSPRIQKGKGHQPREEKEVKSIR